MAADQAERRKRLARLRRLGVKRGTADITPPPKPAPPTDPLANDTTVPLHFLAYQDDLQHAVSIEQVIPGEVVHNQHGSYFSFTTRYPLNAPYGERPLANWLQVPMSTVAAMTGDDAWHDLNWDQVLFIDTETTGLEIAAGTVAFLIGVGYLDGADFVVRQVFMRDFNEEQALLSDLHQLCQRFSAVATFNGKTFDIPLLENRFVLARYFPDLFDGPHFDLLHPSRRVWKRRLENCKLATLETDVLGLNRTVADVPGYFIPSLYRKYLVDQDARPMAGIFYHNELDIVSMAALAGKLGEIFALAPTAMHDEDPLDLLSVGLWHQQQGRHKAAQGFLQHSTNRSLPAPWQSVGQQSLAKLHKKQANFEAALPLWQMEVLSDSPLPALEELAKYYEWRAKDLVGAHKCTLHALHLLNNTASAPPTMVVAWEHRRARLQRKLAAKTSDK